VHITVTATERVELADGYPGYRIRYPHPETGTDWEHLVPVEALATRGELLGLVDPVEIMRVVLAEAYALEETAAPYAAPMSAEAHAVASTLAGLDPSTPTARVLDAASSALDAEEVDAARAQAHAEIAEAITSAELAIEVDAPGWGELAEILAADAVAVERWRAAFGAEQLAPAAEATGARGGSGE
jgi:hypothetical protein